MVSKFGRDTPARSFERFFHYIFRKINLSTTQQLCDGDLGHRLNFVRTWWERTWIIAHHGHGLQRRTLRALSDLGYRNNSTPLSITNFTRGWSVESRIRIWKVIEQFYVKKQIFRNKNWIVPRFFKMCFSYGYMDLNRLPHCT